MRDVAACVWWTGWLLVLAGCQVNRSQTRDPGAGTAPPATTQPARIETSPTPAPAGGEIVARVNGEAITRDELTQALFQRHGRTTLEDLIVHRIVRQAARRAGVTVTDQEVQEFIATRAKRMGVPPDKLAQAMHTNRENWHRRVWQQMVVHRIVERGVKVTDEDLRLAYESGYGETMQAAWILCRKLRDAQQVWEQLRQKPDDFGRLARQDSIDEATRSLSGVFPQRVRRHVFAQEVEANLFKLGEGEISAVLQTRFGYAVFKCIKRFPARDEDYAKVRDKLREEVYKAKVKETAKTFVADLTQNAALESSLYPDLAERRLVPASNGAANGVRP